MRRAVFLDRDGVLNRVVLVDGIPKPPKCIEEIEILPGVIDAIQILKKNNYLPVVVTNQPDVARGTTTKLHVDAINDHVGATTGINYFYTCFHDDVSECACRKPLPGLILQASQELGLDAPKSFMIGDRWRDIEAGQSAGCPTFFIDYSYNELMPKKPYTKVSSLMEATLLIVGDSHESNP